MSNYYMPKEFLNKHGDINPNSYSKFHGSENPTTFNVMFYFMLERARGLSKEDSSNLHQRLYDKFWTNDMKLKTNDYDNEDSFSLDESISFAAACYRYNYDMNMPCLRIVTKQTYYRFYDVIPYLLMCKYPILRYILMPYVSLMILLSIAIVPKGDTSGKQLALIKIIGQRMEVTYTFAKMILNLKGTSFKEALSIYYPEKDHPINVLAREVWTE